MFFSKVAVLCHAIHLASHWDQAAKSSSKHLSFVSLGKYAVIYIDSFSKYLHFLTEMYTFSKANVTNFSVALSRH